MRKFLASNIVFVALALVACSSPQPTAPQLDGIYGGVLTYQGSPLLAYAIDVTTAPNDRISGYGVMVDGGSAEIWVTVSGNSYTDGDVKLIFTDGVGDSLYLDVAKDGAVFNGTWSTSFDYTTGTTRIAHESNVHLLAVTRAANNNPGSLREVFD